jgi:hypothetical protein
LPWKKKFWFIIIFLGLRSGKLDDEDTGEEKRSKKKEAKTEEGEHMNTSYEKKEPDTNTSGQKKRSGAVEKSSTELRKTDKEKKKKEKSSDEDEKETDEEESKEKGESTKITF